MKIDAVHIDIIKRLKEGRKSYQDIAKELDITINTVRSRVKKLTDEGVLEIAGLMDPAKMPGHRIAFVGVNLSTLNLVEKGEEFSRLKGVVSVSVVTGRYDLILVVLLKEGFDLLEFFSKEVYGLKQVRSVETFVAYQSYNLKVPYIL
jgi:Lrp/AsnC family transcriptional regulator for asnA, asnC and gidA